MADIDAAPHAAPGLDSSFLAEPGSVGPARHLVSGWLRASMPREEQLIGDIAVALSEACTNAVVHAYVGVETRDFRVVASHDARAVHVTVTDDGAGMSPRPDSPGVGLGLPLITTLAEAVDIAPGPDGRGTVVMMRFSRNGH